MLDVKYNTNLNSLDWQNIYNARFVSGNCNPSLGLTFLRSPSPSLSSLVHCQAMDVCLLLMKCKSSLAYAPSNLTIFYRGNTQFLEHL